MLVSFSCAFIFHYFSLVDLFNEPVLCSIWFAWIYTIMLRLLSASGLTSKYWECTWVDGQILDGVFLQDLFSPSPFFLGRLPSPVVWVLLPRSCLNLIAENGRWMLLLNFSVSVTVDMAICFSIGFFLLIFNNWVDACQCPELLVTFFWAIVVHFWFLLLRTHLMFQIFLVTPLFNNCLIFSLEIWALED